MVSKTCAMSGDRVQQQVYSSVRSLLSAPVSNAKEVWVEEVSDTVVKLLRAFPKVTQCEYD